MPSAAAITKLGGFSLAVALITSRAGLVLHELGGHGVAALLLGSRLTGWTFFAFAGGWVGYRRATPYTVAEALLIQLAGIAVEVLVALVLAVLARRRTGLVGLALDGAAAAFAIHAGWYLATGTFHGFGDGRLLRLELGPARLAVALPVGAAIVAIGWIAGRRLGARLRPLVDGSRRAVVLALLIAGAIHAGLGILEVRTRAEPTYQATMQPERERAVAAELAAYRAAARARGEVPDAPQLAAVQRRLEREHADAPFAIVLGLILVAATLLGLGTAPLHPGPPLPGRAVVIAGALAVAAIALVVVLDHAR